MSNVIDFKQAAKGKQVIREMACLWIVKLNAGLSEIERQEIHAWLEEDPEHVRALLDAAGMWDKTAVLSELAELFPLQEYMPPKPVPVRRSLAYSVLVVFALALFLQNPLLTWLDTVWPSTASETMPLSYETNIGQQSRFNLPDGSEVILNTNSHIEVSFSSTSRDILLHRGEGHFTVAHDEKRPFRVYANGGVVEAVGTAFTVQQTRRESLEITVLEGEVNFTRIDQAGRAAGLQQAPTAASQPPVNSLPATEYISLTAGESVQVKLDDDLVQKQKIQPNELQGRLAWRHGMLLFQGDSLESVIQEVSRYTTMRIDVDETVRDIKVVGYFRTGDIEGILLTMRDTFHIDIERLGEDHIVLKSND